MPSLPFDCLNDIFEYLKNEEVTLRSCLFVNRLWCESAVKFLWKNVQNANFITLIAFLPDESLEFLYNNGIIIQTPTSNSPMFNYASFCKILDIHVVISKIKKLLRNQLSISKQDLDNKTCMV